MQHFISDLHLSAQRPDLVRAFVDYTQNQLQDADALYIMGDWFEYWIGDDAEDPALQTVFNALTAIKGQRPTYFVHGNRDFLIGSAFADRYEITFLPEASVQTIADRPILLLHGDSLCTDDPAYQAFRQSVRDPDWQQEFLVQSVEDRRMIAEQARAMSKTDSARKSEDIMDVNPQAVINLLNQFNVTEMIHGHTHRPAVHNIDHEGCTLTRHVLPDWDQTGFYTIADTQGIRHEVLPLPSET